MSAITRKVTASKVTASLCALAVAVATVVATPTASFAQRGRQLQLLSDAETDDVLRGMNRPVLEAAGINPEAVQFILVNDRTLNAFVAGGQNIFLHTGLILTADADELVGVVAHETGHIAGGHLVAGKDMMEDAMLSSLIGMGLGIIGGVAAGSANAGIAGVMLGQQLTQRSILSFSRAQEASADQAGLSYLNRAGLSGEGLVTFLRKLDVESPLIGNDRDVGYRLTHPLTAERIDLLERSVAKSPHRNDHVTAKWRDAYARVQAKLYAFLDPMRALRRYRADDHDIVARYGRAYAQFRRGDVKAALPLVDGLLRDEPRNPYFHELKGDLMLQTGQAAAAVAPYRRAVALADHQDSLRVSLSHALLEMGDPRVADEVIANLNRAVRTQGSAFVWRLMARAWSLKGNDGMVAYAGAEESFASGDEARARALADRAMDLLPRGSPGWLRAQDISGQIGSGKSKRR